ncbi:MAG: hypothetical protein DHS20C15_14020 [Planctomycetota bacterium]|nr:MAG: hypothetical protein DHS20C15_14020 [Planctomycetota bacterium]
MICTTDWNRRVRALCLAVTLAGFGSLSTHAQVTGEALDHLEISQLAGGFGGELLDDDGFGFSVARIGDLNDDGIGDIAAGAWGDDDGGLDRGAVWILFLNESGGVESQQKISDLEGGFTGVLNDDDRFGYSLAGLGDHDGDGVEDLAVGAIFDDDGGFAHGAIWILFLDTDGTVKSHQKISDTEGEFEGELHFRDYLGASLTFLGDHDGDGVGDIASGAYRDGEGEFGTEGGEGAVWILRLNTNGTVKSHAKISAQVGGFDVFLDNRDTFGRSIASIGDLDGDSVGDLVVGAPLSHDGETDYWGAVWILFLNADATVKAHHRISPIDGGLAGALLDNQDRFGFAVSNLGDINADGTNDIAVGAPRDDDGSTNPEANRGAVWILLMNPDGSVKQTQKLSDTAGFFDAPLENDTFFGHGVASLGDHDGDGRIEIVAGAPRSDTGGHDRGAVYYIDLVAAPTAHWSSLGHGLAGNSHKPPVLVGTGALAENGLIALTAFHAGKLGEQNVVWLHASPEASYRPYKGGILVPDALAVGATVTPGRTNLKATFLLRTHWPAGLPQGSQMFYQAWIEDDLAPQGWSASNAVLATAP